MKTRLELNAVKWFLIFTIILCGELRSCVNLAEQNKIGKIIEALSSRQQNNKDQIDNVKAVCLKL